MILTIFVFAYSYTKFFFQFKLARHLVWQSPDSASLNPKQPDMCTGLAHLLKTVYPLPPFYLSGDLALLLTGSRRRTSHIEFGAHQVRIT